MAFDLKFVIHFCKDFESTLNVHQFPEINFIFNLLRCWKRFVIYMLLL
jgi:hypothetical protein